MPTNSVNSAIQALFSGPLPGTAMLVLLSAIGLMLLTTLVLVVVALFYRYRNLRKARRWARMERKWEPLLLEVLAGDRPSSDLRFAVGAGEELFFVDFLYRYARRLRGPDGDMIGNLARPYLGPIARGVRNGDAERRARAVQTLGVLDFAGSADLIRAAVNDPSPLVAMIAARSLARPDQSRHVDLVLSAIHRFESWNSRFLSSMLAAMGGDAAPRLRATLADRSRPVTLRVIAADALRKLGDTGAGTVAVQVLEEKVERDLHSAVLRLLRQVGQPEHAPAVRRLTLTSDAVVRAQAIRTLGRLGSEQDAESLRGAVDDESSWVAIHALRGLREVGRHDLVRELGSSGHTRAGAARQVLAEAY